MKEKKNHSGIWGKICIVVAVIVAIFMGGYFFLDKLIVPSYFSDYGISGMGDLIGVINSLYKNPKESDLIKNPWSESDYVSATTKLDESGYNINENGDIVVENFKLNATNVELTDREFIAVCNKLIKQGYLEELLPNINYTNFDKIDILQFNINIDEESKQNDVYNAANINFIARLSTTDLIIQISQQMDTPESLLKLIIPSILYFEVSYDIDLSKPNDEKVTNGSIAINGMSAKESEILINLLIDFIFPPEDEMNMQKFTKTFGDIILTSINELGDFKFKQVDERNGFLIVP